MTIHTPTKDAWVVSASPDTNYDENRLIVCGWTGYKARAFMEFDISSITVASVVSAKLRLYLIYESDKTVVHTTQRITSAWTETGVTWNNQPTVTTTNQSNNTIVGQPTNPGRWVEWDITNLLKDESGTTLGIMIRSVETDSTSTQFNYSSSEGTNPPQLLIDNDFYIIASGGNDASDGQSWANAWATINKAATTVADGTTVHIGHGTYNSEPAGNTIAPVNAGSTGIKYKPETADTGAEVAGSVTIEKN